MKGKRISDALEKIEGALSWAEKHGKKNRTRKLRAAAEILRPKPTLPVPVDPLPVPEPASKARPWLRVLSANVYVANRRLQDDLELFERLKPDAIGVQEGNRLPKMERFGFRKFVDWEDGRFSAEVPVLVRRTSKISVRNSRTVQGARGVPGQGISNPRWITVVRIEKRGRRASIVNTHLHAAIQRPNGTRRSWTLKRVRQYRDHMRELLQVVEAEREAGWSPVVTGDMNYRLKGKIRKPRQTWKWSPFRALARAGLTYRAFGLDGYAFDPDVFEEIRPAKKIGSKGSDHDYVLARLRWKN